MARRKKSKAKKRTQKAEESDQKVPRTMLFSRGKLNPVLRRLQHDLKRLLLPHTAARLKVGNASGLFSDVFSVASHNLTH